MPSNRGGGGGGRGGPQPRDVLVSKKLSWLLRHGAEKEGLVLGKGGYVGLDDVVSFSSFCSSLIVFECGASAAVSCVLCALRRGGRRGGFCEMVP